MISGLGSIAFVAQSAASIRPQVDGAPPVEPVPPVRRAPVLQTAEPRRPTTDIGTLVRLAQVLGRAETGGAVERRPAYPSQAAEAPTGQRLDRTG